MSTLIFRAAINRLFTRKYLIFTNTASCGVLLGLGDMSIQTVEYCKNNRDKFDFKRAAKMFTIGIVLGPFNHVWYSFLDKALPGINFATISKKILADQACASPFFAFTFFIGTGTLEGKPFNASFGEFRAKFWEVYKADWTLWPAAQAINFYFLKPKYRVVYVAFVTLVWNTYLSYVKHKDHTLTEPQVTEKSS